MKNIKIYLLLALLLSMMGAAKAQEWMSILKDNSEWNIFWQSTGVAIPALVTESLMVSGDTLVDGVQYKKLFRKLSSQTEHWHGCMEYCPYGLMREELSGKVFFKPDDQEIEYLLYDFGMNVNDTAVMYWCQLPNWEVHVRIDSIATQHIAGAERRVFYVSSKDTYSDWRWLNTWVEGIGATEGLLYSCHVVSAGGITLHELLCYHEDGELVWQNPNYKTCLIDNYSGIQDNTKESGVVVCPNPANGVVHIEGIEAAEVMVYNALGQLVKTVWGTNEIDLSGLVEGVYLLRIEDAEGKSHTTRVAVKE